MNSSAAVFYLFFFLFHYLLTSLSFLGKNDCVSTFSDAAPDDIKYKVLITGGLGFIGSHLSELLLSKGHNVVIYDVPNKYTEIPFWRDQFTKKLLDMYQDHVKIITNHSYKTSDLQRIDYDHLFEDGIDVLVHLAATPGVRATKDDPYHVIENNLFEAMRLFEASKNHVKHIVFASSSSVYGNRQGSTVPSKELDPINNVESYYAASKASLEMFARVFAQKNSIVVTGLRFFSIYGPRGRLDMAPQKFTFASLAHSTIYLYGEQVRLRAYTYVADCVRGIKFAIERPTVRRQFSTINIGTDQVYSTTHLIQTIGRFFDFEQNVKYVRDQFGDVDTTRCNIIKAKNEIGFNADTSLLDGIKNTVEWAKESWDSMNDVQKTEILSYLARDSLLLRLEQA